MEAVLGTEVLNSKKEPVAVSTFSGPGKLVGLYFSAHWCPPCKAFTPTLVTFYNKVKAEAKGANFEVVFVSYDRDEKTYDEYYATMPWLTISWDKGDFKNGLGDKFDVKGIPNFVILDGETGLAKESNGRGKVTADPQGETFPWGL